MMELGWAKVGLIAVACAISAGCAPSASQSVAAPAPPETAQVPATPDSTTDDSPDTSGEVTGIESTEPATFTWKDVSGYSYSATITAAESDVTLDVANAKPGQAQLTWDFVGTIVVSNNTSGHNAPWPDLRISAVWESNSLVCNSSNAGYSLRLETPNVNYCMDKYAQDYEAVRGAGISAGGSVSAEFRITDEALGRNPLIVSEDDAEAARDQLAQPYAYVVYSGSVVSDGGCSVDRDSGDMPVVGASTELDC